MIPADFPAKPIVLDEDDTKAVLNLRCRLPRNDISLDLLAEKPELPVKTMLRLPLKPQPVCLGADSKDLRRTMYQWKKLVCALNFYSENSIIFGKLPYKKDDFLWVKEPLEIAAVVNQNVEHELSFKKLITIKYVADGDYADVDFGERLNDLYEVELYKRPRTKKINAALMERPAARIALRINNVRVEQVQSISPADCFAEGIRIKPFGAFNPKRPGNWDNLSEAKKEEYAHSAARATYIAEIEYANAFITEFGKRWDARYGKQKGLRFADNPWVQVIEFSRIR
jgi:hypothetical protein